MRISVVGHRLPDDAAFDVHELARSRHPVRDRARRVREESRPRTQLPLAPVGMAITMLAPSLNGTTPIGSLRLRRELLRQDSADNTPELITGQGALVAPELQVT